MSKTLLLTLFSVIIVMLLSCGNPSTTDDDPDWETGTVTDVDGNTYQTVKIGNQWWLAENLRVTHNNDGKPIPHVKDSVEWVACTTGTAAYCYYDNDSASNADKYGVLYNWYAVNTGKLAPTGWHVPTDAEWDTLQNYLIANGYNWDGTTTYNKIGKSMAAKTDWTLSNDEGVIGNDLSSNNSSGFSALPGGFRSYYDGDFGFVRNNCDLWSATECDATDAYYRSLDYNYFYLYRGEENKEYGSSVRLVQD